MSSLIYYIFWYCMLVYGAIKLVKYECFFMLLLVLISALGELKNASGSFEELLRKCKSNA